MRLLTVAFIFLTPSLSFAKEIPSKYSQINSPQPTIQVLFPQKPYEGSTISAVKFSIDGSWYEHTCAKNDRDFNGKICGETRSIIPGPHILSLLYCENQVCDAFGKTWKKEIKFNVGLREAVSIDLTALMSSEKQTDYVKRRKIKKVTLTPCAAAIENTLQINTCRSPGIKRFSKAVDKIASTCAKSWSKEVELLSEFVIWDVGFLDADRCYNTKEIAKYIPKNLTSYWGSQDFWPQGTIKDNMSSWGWAHEMTSGESYGGSDAKTFKKNAKATLKKWQRRQAVVDQMIDLSLNPAKNLSKAIASAKKGKWSMNPTTINGHRIFWIGTLLSQKYFNPTPELSALFAAGIVKDPKFHCDYEPEAGLVLGLFLDDDQVTQEEWTSIEAMLKRTPSDSYLANCEVAAYKSKKSPVDAYVRAKAVAAADCDPKKPGFKRGQFLKNIMTNNDLVEPTVKDRIVKEFASCIPK